MQTLSWPTFGLSTCCGAKTTAPRLEHGAFRVDSGISDGCRAQRKLFTAKVLRSPNEYVHISQKLLKGAAARAMMFWLCGVVFHEAKVTDSQHDLCLRAFILKPFGSEASLQLLLGNHRLVRVNGRTRDAWRASFVSNVPPRKFFPDDVMTQIHLHYDKFRRSYN